MVIHLSYTFGKINFKSVPTRPTQIWQGLKVFFFFFCQCLWSYPYIFMSMFAVTYIFPQLYACWKCQLFYTASSHSVQIDLWLLLLQIMLIGHPFLIYSGKISFKSVPIWSTQKIKKNLDVRSPKLVGLRKFIYRFCSGLAGPAGYLHMS